MKKCFLLLFVLCLKAWGQNDKTPQYIVLEYDTEFLSFLKKPTIVSPLINKTIQVDGAIYFSENGGQIIIKPSQNNRIVFTPPQINSPKQKMFNIDTTYETTQKTQTRIRKGNAQTSEGEEPTALLSVSPIPASTEINLYLNKEGSYFTRYKIYNAYGMLESELDFNNQNTKAYTINICELKNTSLYIIEVTYSVPRSFPLVGNDIYTERRTFVKN